MFVEKTDNVIVEEVKTSHLGNTCFYVHPKKRGISHFNIWIDTGNKREKIDKVGKAIVKHLSNIFKECI